ncbi:HNH endonuclease [Paenibacillus sp. UASWS1643]|uniref:HNH endonuclease n=1 Tax=Paenibacillus sp. UASWS1643 TaxID=2580422 RepID=UPI00123B213E|nr:HNH endonuclease [Paenibacillus sp. UASWS1643]KAA8750168.1 hypothetical protein FE296_16370 [Paenibacillus sp. UASWS1643]
MVREIELSNGKKALVDDEDYGWLSETKWSDDSRGYAIRRVRDGRNTTEKMHRLIVGANPGQIVDHINGVPWDNRRDNLRVVTDQQNSFNTQISSTNKTGFKGVAVYKARKNPGYTAQITVNYRKIHLGCFDDPVEAAIAYNNAARMYFGEFAILNEIPEDRLNEEVTLAEDTG